MIDREQLRELGWADGLIDEVLRQAAEIERHTPHLSTIASPLVPAVVGTQLFVASGFVPNAASEEIHPRTPDA
jgi:hypothetical protein